MSYIEWEKKFELGIEPFDEHHKHLVSLINKSYNFYISGSPSEEIGPVLEELINYALYHFSAEELWMEKQHYPKINQHSAAHYKFSNKLIIFKNDYKKGNKTLSLDILMFLKNWLTDHILTIDSEYTIYAAARGVAI